MRAQEKRWLSMSNACKYNSVRFTIMSRGGCLILCNPCSFPQAATKKAIGAPKGNGKTAASLNGAITTSKNTYQPCATFVTIRLSEAIPTATTLRCFQIYVLFPINFNIPSLFLSVSLFYLNSEFSQYIKSNRGNKFRRDVS